MALTSNCVICAHLKAIQHEKRATDTQMTEIRHPLSEPKPS